MAGSRMRLMVAAALVMVVLVLAVQLGEATISCGTVSGKLSNCLGYLTGSGGAPDGTCCGGVQSLYDLTKLSKPDRVTACNCIKKLASALGSKLKASSVSALPGKCGVNLGYGISASTNCAGIP